MPPLPRPGSRALKTILSRRDLQIVYRVLYENRTKGLTYQDLSKLAAPLLRKRGLKATPSQIQRRKRDLHSFFDFEITSNGGTRHRLIGVKARTKVARANISARLRYQILTESGHRCVSCGRPAPEVTLVIDHKVPLDLGGTNAPENLQALCTECNMGKKNLFSDYGAKYREELKRSLTHEEPHRRIGELLKALERQWVPEELIQAVASAKQHQADWQKRLRELRVLGWDFEFQRIREGGRVHTSYRLKKWRPWPKGSISSEIRKRELMRKEQRQS